MWFCFHSDTQSIWRKIINVSNPDYQPIPKPYPDTYPSLQQSKYEQGRLQCNPTNTVSTTRPIPLQKNPIRWGGNQQWCLDHTPNPDRNMKNWNENLQKNHPYHSLQVIGGKFGYEWLEKFLRYEIIEWNQSSVIPGYRKINNKIL